MIAIKWAREKRYKRTTDYDAEEEEEEKLTKESSRD